MNQELRTQNKKLPIIILHGWGIDGTKYKTIKSLFEKEGHTVFAPDLPGFGKEPLKKNRMVLDDYVSFVKLYMRENNIEKAIIIGHSFGGRVAAKFTSIHPDLVEKLILTGAPLIRTPLTLKKQIVSILTKIAKSLTSFLPISMQNILRKILYRSINEWDYYKSGELRETFKAIVAEDLKSTLPKIETPTLVLWGKQEKTVPVAIGRQIAALIPHGTFIVIPEATHKLPYENPSAFVEKSLAFII